MSDPVGRWLVLELLFVLTGGFCALASYAIQECTESKWVRAAAEGDKKAARILQVVQSPEDFRAAMRTGAMVFGFFAVMNPLTGGLVSRAEALFPENDALAQLVGGCVWILLMLAAVVLMDLVPERYACCRADAALRRLFTPAKGLAALLRPLSRMLLWLARLLLRLVGVRPESEGEEISEDEIRLMVDAGEESGAIGQQEKELIEKVFEFDDTTAEDVMVHRTDMEMVWLEDTDEEILTLIRESGLSRFPVCGEDADDIVGILSTRDYLLNRQQPQPKPLAELLRPAFFVPEAIKADVLLRDMQKQKTHIALVVDEYGGTAGLVTMEDLLEELVGEIYDEFDQEEEQEITPLGGDTWKIAGSAPLEEVAAALGLEADSDELEEYETLGGLVFGRLSVIPQDGTCPVIDAMGMHIQVKNVADHRVEWALVTKLPQPVQAEE